MGEFSPRRLREARIAAGLTPEQVATAIGRSSFSTREYERGRITPPTTVIGKLASALGCAVSDLFTHAGDADAAP